MRSCSPLRFLLPAALLLSAAAFSQVASGQSPSAQATPHRRIASVTGTSRVAVPHTIPRRVLAAATDLGDVAPDLKLDSLMITFNLTDTQQAVLDRLLIDLQDPSSPRYRQWLTPEQFGAQFGLAAADLAQVSAWLTAQGFTVTGTARGSNFITFSGTAAQVKQSFGASIHNVMVDGEAHISNLTDPALPAGIASVVTSISGLNDIRLKTRARPHNVQLPAVDTTGIHPNFTSSISGNHYMAPGDFYTIYNESPLLTAATPINGKGITIAVVGQTNIANSDVTSFRTASGLGAYCYTTLTTGQTIGSNGCSAQSLPIFATTTYGTSPGTSSGDLPEAMLDVEWAGAIAPAANIIFVNSTNVLFTSLVQAINNNVAPIISISYGECEALLGTSFLTQLNQSFQQANAQGQTIVGPSGDSGATDCDYNDYPAVDGLGVDFPASSAYVTSAGGSMFNEGTATGATTYWSSNSSSSTNNAGSALSYIPETVWNESSAAAGLIAGGGGFSLYFPKPYWQIGAGIPSDSARDVPDISLNAATSHDGTLYCVSGSCVTGFRASDGQSLSVVGGTSVAAPSFAAVLALVEQKIAARIGNAGPELYALATVANVYHDITTGNNNSACTPGSHGCPASGILGYAAGVGYDQASGLGSVNVANLVNNWNFVTPAPPGATIGTTISTTTVSLTPSSTSQTCGVANATLALTVRVAAAAGSGVPTGSIQLLVDNVAFGSPLALTGGSVTANVATGVSSTFPAGISTGFHTITAVYSGDITYSGSKGNVTADVVSSNKPDFTFTAVGTTPCNPSVTVRTGTTATGVTLTVTPVNGFTGTVTLTATSNASSLNATYTVTPATLTFTSPTSATASLVLNAFVSSAVSGTALARKNPATAAQTPLHAPWYITGSGAAFGCILLLIAPRRRRWGALLAVLLSVAALSVSGCGSTSSSTATGPTINNAATGTYDVQVIATSSTSTGTVSHLVDITFNVTN